MGKRKAAPKKATGSTSSSSLGSSGSSTPVGNGSESPLTAKDVVRQMAEELAALSVSETPEDSARSATGMLSSHPLSSDVQITGFSLLFHGVQLIEDTTLSLNNGRRYGLIGLNGSGKSTFLKCVGHRDVPVPSHVDIFLLEREVAPSDLTPIQCVLELREKEVARLEREADLLLATEDGPESERLQQIYERLYEDLELEKAVPRAAEILHGLGFTPEMQRKASREFSGGWRMRIALAQALFVRPSLLLLDEPTNHLDLEACVWLEEYLRTYPRCLVLISHSQDFMNNVCTNIIHLHLNKLIYYTGNYDSYVKTRAELEENQMKRYNWEQAQIKDMKEYIARFGHGSAKLARQAQSKEKALEKMSRNLTDKVVADRTLTFRFPDCGSLAPPVLQFTEVSFGYPIAGSKTRLLYEKIDLGIDLDSRVAIVGPNGTGKSTLLKLMVGELVPTDGMVSRHNHLRIARYHQHLAETLDMELSPLQFMLTQFPDTLGEKGMRSQIGRFGITGKEQTAPIKNLSDGQRSRVVFSWLAFLNPHLLLLDEPTNHLDIETIDSLAEALNSFEGGVVLVSHDFRLIGQVAEEIWMCENRKVKKWTGDILEYKNHLRQLHGLDPV